MTDFAVDTTLEGANGRFGGALSRDWEVWGPFGGYVAALALRAIGNSTELRRPASIAVHFLSPASFDQEIEIAVSTLRQGKRSAALQAQMTQGDQRILQATAWVISDGMSGLEHDHAAMPRVPGFAELSSFSELASNFDEWYPLWHGSIEGRPVLWSSDPQPAPPIWHTWMRLTRGMAADDPFLAAARSLLWLDLMMWNATVPPHMPWPVSHLAPSLDLTAIFHDAAPDEEWLLCDAEAPIGKDNLVGGVGRVWTASGRLIATGTSTLFCRPNPLAAGG